MNKSVYGACTCGVFQSPCEACKFFACAYSDHREQVFYNMRKKLREQRQARDLSERAKAPELCEKEDR